MIDSTLSALQLLLDRAGERWLFGPACLAGEQRSYTTGWASWRGWLAEVELAYPDVAHTVSRLRLLTDPVATRWPARLLLRTASPGLAAAPLTIEDISRHALDGLYRSGLVDLQPDAANRPGLVDLSRVLLLLDGRLSGTTPTGGVFGAPVVFGWSGLLAEAWYA